MVLLIVFVGVVAIFVILASIPICVKMSIKTRTQFSNVNFEVKIIGIIKMRFRFKLVYNIGDGIFVARVMKNNALHIIYRLGQKTKKRNIQFSPGLLRAIDIQTLNVFVKIGSGNAFSDVMLCESIYVLLDGFRAIVGARGKVAAIPEFGHNEFILNLDSILKCFLIKLIVEACKTPKTESNERKSKLCTQSKPL